MQDSLWWQHPRAWWCCGGWSSGKPLGCPGPSGQAQTHQVLVSHGAELLGHLPAHLFQPHHAVARLHQRPSTPLLSQELPKSRSKVVLASTTSLEVPFPKSPEQAGRVRAVPGVPHCPPRLSPLAGPTMVLEIFPLKCQSSLLTPIFPILPHPSYGFQDPHCTPVSSHGPKGSPIFPPRPQGPPLHPHFPRHLGASLLAPGNGRLAGAHGDTSVGLRGRSRVVRVRACVRERGTRSVFLALQHRQRSALPARLPSALPCGAGSVCTVGGCFWGHPQRPVTERGGWQHGHSSSRSDARALDTLLSLGGCSQIHWWYLLHDDRSMPLAAASEHLAV